MKYFIISLLIHLTAMKSTSSIYEIQSNDLSGNSIDISNMSGKKLLVLEFDASAPDFAQLSMIDSICRSAGGTFSLIAVPVADFGTPIADSALKRQLIDSLHFSFTIAALGNGSKSFGSAQHNLLRWLTSVGSNGHFDTDITQPGQLFIVSESGVLYSEMMPSLSAQLIGNTIQETITETN